MVQLDHAIRLKILNWLVRPVVRFALRYSLRLPDIMEALKCVLVETAASQLTGKDGKINASRISVMTGVHRRDVMRIRRGTLDFSYEKDLVTRVVGQWRSDPHFVSSSGAPKVLRMDGTDSEFARLVQSVSKDVNPAAVLFELQRIGAVQSSKNTVKLVVESIVPKGEPVAGFSIFSNDACDLLDVVDQNILGNLELPQFHARTEYDNVRPSALRDLKIWFLKHGHEFHAKVREIISKHDQDINPDPKFKGEGVRVVFSAFSNVEEKKL